MERQAGQGRRLVVNGRISFEDKGLRGEVRGSPARKSPVCPFSLTDKFRVNLKIRTAATD
jgi:hypothetical protein